MHDTANVAGKIFFETYTCPTHTNVLDVGSQDVNGSLKAHVGHLKYTGVDIEAGAGVDVVCPPGEPFPFGDASFDMAISTSCFEHDQCFWVTFLEILRVLKPGGFFYMNAPSNGYYHGYPYDNWRFYPDAGKALVAWAKRNSFNIRLAESGTLKRQNDIWNDFFAIFQKAPFTEQNAYIADKFEGAMNVRRREDGELSVIDLPEDMRIVESLRCSLAAAEAALARQREEIAEKQATLEGQREEIAEKQATLEEQHEEIVATQTALDMMRKSLSWRLTKPLRSGAKRWNAARSKTRFGAS